MIHAGFVIVAFEVGFCHQAHEIFVSLQIFCEQDQMVVAFTIADCDAIVTRTGCNIRFYSDDRLYAFFLADFIELDRTIHISVVGECDGFHSGLLCDVYHVVEFG